MATATAQYYCYQCMNQTQVDLNTFTCRRCGLGFIQEMPQDPIPPPRDASVDVYGMGPLGADGQAQSNSPGLPAGDRQGPQGDFSRMFMQPGQQGSVPMQNNVRQQMGPMMQAAYGPFPGNPMPGGRFPVGQQFPPGVRPVIHGQVTITQHMPADGSGMPPLQQQQHPQGVFIQRQAFSPNMGPSQQNPMMNMMQGPHVMQMPHQQQHWQQAGGPPRMMNVTFNPMMHGGGQMPQQQMPHNIVHPQMMIPGGQMGQPQPQPGQPGTVQQDGVMIFGVNEDGQVQHIQSMVNTVGGNMHNLMELITHNIDDVITAMLNQMGTQGGPPPITQEDVDRIPTHPVTKEMISENKSCSICLENFNHGEPFKELSCSHQFHGSCIDRWLLIHGNCPICRAHFGPTTNNGGGDNQQPQQQQFQFMMQPPFGNYMMGQPGQPHPQNMRFHMYPGQQPQFIMRHSGPRGRFGPVPSQQGQPQPQHQQQRSFAFSPPMNHNFDNRRLQQFPPMFNMNQPPAGRMQFVNVGGPAPQPGQNGQDSVVWSGQVFLNDPAGPTIVLDGHMYNNGQPQHPHATHHHHHHHPQQNPNNTRMGPNPTNQRAPQLASASRAWARPQGNVPSANGAAPGPVPPNILQSIISSVTNAILRPPVPPSSSSSTSSSSTTPALSPQVDQSHSTSEPSAGSTVATATIPPSDGAAANTEQESSVAVPSAPVSQQPPHMQEDLDFD